MVWRKNVSNKDWWRDAIKKGSFLGIFSMPLILTFTDNKKYPQPVFQNNGKNYDKVYIPTFLGLNFLNINGKKIFTEQFIFLGHPYLIIQKNFMNILEFMDILL